MSRLPSNVQQLSAVSDKATNLISAAGSGQQGREAIAAQKAMQQERIQADKEQAEASRAQAAKMKAQEQAFQSAEGAKDRAAAERRHQEVMALNESELRERQLQSDREEDKKKAQDALAAQSNALERAKWDLEQKIATEIDPQLRDQFRKELGKIRNDIVTTQGQLTQIGLYANRSKKEIEEQKEWYDTTLEEMGKQIENDTALGQAVGQGIFLEVAEEVEQLVPQLTAEGFKDWMREESPYVGSAFLGAGDMLGTIHSLIGLKWGRDAILSYEQLQDLARDKTLQANGMDEQYLSRYRGQSVNAILRDKEFQEALHLDFLKGLGDKAAVSLAGAVKDRGGKELDVAQVSEGINSLVRFMIRDNSESGEELQQQNQEVQSVIKSLSQEWGISPATLNATMASLATELQAAGKREREAAAPDPDKGETDREEGAQMLWGLTEVPEIWFHKEGLNERGARGLLGEMMESAGSKLGASLLLSNAQTESQRVLEGAIKGAHESFGEMGQAEAQELEELLQRAGLEDAYEDWTEENLEAVKLYDAVEGLRGAGQGGSRLTEDVLERLAELEAAETKTKADLARQETEHKEGVPDRLVRERELHLRPTTGPVHPDQLAVDQEEAAYQALLAQQAAAPIRTGPAQR